MENLIDLLDKVFMFVAKVVTYLFFILTHFPNIFAQGAIQDNEAGAQSQADDQELPLPIQETGQPEEERACHLIEDAEAKKKEQEQLRKYVEATKKEQEQLRKDVEATKKGQEQLRKDVEATKKGQGQLCKDVEATKKGQEQLRKDVEATKKGQEQLCKDVEAKKKEQGQLRKDVEAKRPQIAFANADVPSELKTEELSSMPEQGEMGHPVQQDTLMDGRKTSPAEQIDGLSPEEVKYDKQCSVTKEQGNMQIDMVDLLERDRGKAPNNQEQKSVETQMNSEGAAAPNHQLLEGDFGHFSMTASEDEKPWKEKQPNQQNPGDGKKNQASQTEETSPPDKREKSHDG